MRVAFCGKGGSGKTTLSSLFVSWLESRGEKVIAIDGDINQHLGGALGFSESEIAALPKIGMQQDLLRTYVRGTNERIRKISDILETTPPGRGSGFFRFSESENEVLKHFTLRRGSLRFMAIGGHTIDDMATTCYHKFTAAMGIFLNHLLDGPGEYVVGDMVAGADPFASSGLVTRYDTIILVVEPTVKSVEVYHQAMNYLGAVGRGVKVIGNKINDDDDLAFVEDHVKDDLIGYIPASSFIRKLDRGIKLSIRDLDAPTAAVLERIKRLVDSSARDWDRYLDLGLHYHKVAAESWATNWLGTDVMGQVDPGFRYAELASA